MHTITHGIKDGEADAAKAAPEKVEEAGKHRTHRHEFIRVHAAHMSIGIAGTSPQPSTILCSPAVLFLHTRH